MCYDRVDIWLGDSRAMIFNFVFPLNAWFSHGDRVFNLISQIFWYLPWHSTLAQNIKDPDLLGQWQKAFDHFVQSGQVWALLIGIFIGFLLKSMTSFG